jgi:hypothetical protein
MFKFINEIINKEKETIKINISKNLLVFLQDKIDMSKINECDFCYADITNQKGLIKILPTSKYYQILKKYKKDNNLSDDIIDELKKSFCSFKDESYNDILNKNFQYMKIGRFINIIFNNLKPNEIELLVNSYKEYQIIFSNQ